MVKQKASKKSKPSKKKKDVSSTVKEITLEA